MTSTVYQSLPNKYRPILFKDLVGQNHNQKFFKSLIANGQISRNIVLAGFFGSSKCVTMDTLIYTNKGLIPISQVSDNRIPDTFTPVHGISICNLNGELEPISQFYYNGVQPCKTISTKLGFSISGTLVHPLLCMNKQTGNLEYVQIQDLSKDTHCLVIQAPHRFPESNYSFIFKEEWANDTSMKFSKAYREGFSLPKELSVDLAQLFGMIVADGYTGDSTKSLDLLCDIGVDPDLEPLILGMFKRLFNYLPSQIIDKRKVGYSKITGKPIKLVCYKLNSIQAKKFFEFLGGKCTTSEFKEIPFSILESSKPIQAAFLRGLFECDGMVSLNKFSNKLSGEIKYSSKSSKLIKQIQKVLFNFGIVSTIKAQDCSWVYKNERKHGIYWILNIHDKYSRTLFRKEIGFLSNRKQERLLKITDDSFPMQYGTTYNIPYQVDKVIKVLKEDYNGWGKQQKAKAFGNVLGSRKPVTYSQVIKFNNFCEKDNKPLSPLFQEFLSWKDAGYYFDEIAEISDIFEAEVCDISVDGTHSFNAAGFVSHNTTTARIYARALMCEHPTPDGEPCNQCDSCLKSLQGIHPDIMEIDASSKGGKEDIINLVEVAKTPPLFSKHRVIIDDEVQAHSRQAWDALLKLIEEPPPFLTFIFCTTEKDKVRPAILSRCAVRDVNLLTPDQAINHLRHICELEGFTYSDTALKIIAQASQGHPRDLLKNLEQISFIGDITEENAKLTLSDSFIDEVYKFLLILLIQDHKSLLEYLLHTTVSPQQLYNGCKEVLLHFLYNVFQQYNVTFNVLINMVSQQLSSDLVKAITSISKDFPKADNSAIKFITYLLQEFNNTPAPVTKSDSIYTYTALYNLIHESTTVSTTSTGATVVTNTVRKRRREFVNSYSPSTPQTPQPTPVSSAPEPQPSSSNPFNQPQISDSTNPFSHFSVGSNNKVYNHTLIQNGFNATDIDDLNIIEL